jgi:hypothetical protein
MCTDPELFSAMTSSLLSLLENLLSTPIPIVPLPNRAGGSSQPVTACQGGRQQKEGVAAVFSFAKDVVTNPASCAGLSRGSGFVMAVLSCRDGMILL